MTGEILVRMTRQHGESVKTSRNGPPDDASAAIGIPANLPGFLRLLLPADRHLLRKH